MYPITEEYAEHVLLCYRPWQGDFKKSIGTRDTWIDQYYELLESEQCPSIVKIKHNQAKDTHDAKKFGERMNEPLAHNTIQDIDPNDNDIDQDTRDACDLFPSLFHLPENNDQWIDQLDLGVNFDWSKRKVTLPHAGQ